MNTHDIAHAWIQYTLAQLNGDIDSNSEWAMHSLLELARRRPSEAYEVIKDILRLCQDPGVIACLGAGPLENVLANMSSVYVDRAIFDSGDLPTLKEALMHVWLETDGSDAAKRLYEFLGVPPPV